MDRPSHRRLGKHLYCRYLQQPHPRGIGRQYRPVAGNGTFGYGGDTGSATNAEIANPNGVAVDGSGNIFIADTNNNRVREVSGGIINTIAGNGTCCFSGDSGPATSAQLNNPRAVMVDGSGNVYITDYNNRVREITSGGAIVTVAGNGNYADAGDGGPALNASFSTPQGMAMDSSGNIYVADTNDSAVRVLTPAATSPVLTITSSQTEDLIPGGAGSDTLTDTNAAGVGPTSGTVTVTEIPPAGQIVNSMSGGGWTCGISTCSRSDVLSGGAFIPPIDVSVTVFAAGSYQVTNEATASGGGAFTAGASDVATIALPPASITALSPNFVAEGSPAVSMTITGNGITPGSSIYFSMNSTITVLPVLRQSATQATVTIPAALLTASGNVQIVMLNGAGAQSNSLPFTVSANTPQTITFGTLPNVTLSTGSFTVSATSDSGLPVTFTSSTQFCSVSGTTVTIIGSGGCAITASQAGNATYAPATPVTQSFTVAFVTWRRAITITRRSPPWRKKVLPPDAAATGIVRRQT